jgi:hypothetical protein
MTRLTNALRSHDANISIEYALQKLHYFHHEVQKERSIFQKMRIDHKRTPKHGTQADFHFELYTRLQQKVGNDGQLKPEFMPTILIVHNDDRPRPPMTLTTLSMARYATSTDPFRHPWYKLSQISIETFTEHYNHHSHSSATEERVDHLTVTSQLGLCWRKTVGNP